MKAFDFVVVGGGSAGYAAARTAVAAGLKTAVVEGGRDVGGLCILRGCMPSKALIESANRNLTLQRAGEFGLRASGLEVHADEVIARKRRLIGEFADYRREQLESGAFEFIRSRAKFVDAQTLELTGLDGSIERVSSKTFLISTGSVVSHPPVPGLAEAGAWISDDVLELEQLPKSLAVLGSGPVALEMAHYFAALGVEVTVIQRGPHLLSSLDPDLADTVQAAFEKRGIRVFTGTSITAIRNGDEKVIEFDHDGEAVTVRVEAILNALGRSPATSGLGLDAAGVELDRGRIRTTESQQTSRPHIFAAGDVCGPLEVVHIAISQGEIAARNAARWIEGGSEAEFEVTDYRLKLFAVFTEPQVAAVGLSEREATEAGLDFVVGKYPFDDHGKSLVMGEPEGFVKLIGAKADGEILGGAVVGPHASDLIHEVVVAMAFRSTAAQFAAIPHYHPTLSEIWSYPAEEIADSVG